MLKRKMLATMLGLVIAGAAAPAARAATIEEESGTGSVEEDLVAKGRFVRWRNTDGTLNCYPGCDTLRPCC